MSTRNLKHLFRPDSVAVVGASVRERSAGGLVMRNLLQGGFAGPVMPVNPHYRAVAGVLAYPDIASLPVIPSLAVICTQPGAVIPAMEELGRRGTRAVVVLSDGLSRGHGENGEATQQAVLETARRYEMRLLGPNSLGLLVPGIGLNASFAHKSALPGKIAFASQSGALCTVVLDWARSRNIGFSHFISLGNSVDVDFGDVLDYLGSDPSTRAILLYIESIHQRRNFMSAARAAARNKPVLAIRAGRGTEGARAAATHTGAMAGSDAVYDAALRRAGMLRVSTIEELFAAVETLAYARPVRGDRLALLTNGGGLGVMGVDHLTQIGGRLAVLSELTLAKLDRVLTSTWSRSNPVDINGDAPGDRYVAALRILFEAEEVDATICMHAPTAVSSSTRIAEAVIGLAQQYRDSPLMTCWAGGESVQNGRDLFDRAGIPCYDTPELATRAFMHLIEHQRNRITLMEVPPSAPSEFTPATAAARLVVANVQDSGRDTMTEPEAKAVLTAYGIPAVAAHIARTPAEASRIARSIGGRLALKILSPDISHKSDVGGVILDLDGPLEVEKAAHLMLERLKAANPEAKVTGFTVQPMAQRGTAYELIIGVASDPVFGPVILFGQGGTATEIIGDSAMALPPLNMALARELIGRTRVYRQLQGYRDRPAIDLEALCLALLQVSQIVIDIPEIVELDINPLFADAQGVLALDARIKLAPPGTSNADRLAIRPYPKELEEHIVLANQRDVLLRPIRPEDEPNHHVFISKLSHEDKRFRFFGQVAALPHTEMARLTQIDYDREMAIIATAKDDAGNFETLGVIRIITDPDNISSEFSIVVRSDMGKFGIGRALLNKIIKYCRARGTKTIAGQVLRDNSRMLRIVEGLGFTRHGIAESDVVEVTLDLTTPE